MRTSFRKVMLAALAAVTVAGATVAATGSAEARYWGHRGGWGWGGPALIGGLALGAYAASRPYYGYGPAYGYYDGGCLRRRVVGYTAYGRPLFRTVNVCY